jgi:hypothetical protein
VTRSARVGWISLALAVVIAVGGAGAYAVMAVMNRDPDAGGAGRTHDVPAAWRAVRDGDGHITHVAYKGLACHECHPADQPYAKPPAAICTKCHGDRPTPLHPGKGAPRCTECHAFGGDHEIGAHACMRCHERPQGELAAVGIHGEEDCGQCHQPHDVPATAPRACTDCHAAEHTKHGAVPGAQQCLDCHQPHEAAKAADRRCVECHATNAPIVGPRALFSTVKGGHDACTGCHVPHRFGEKEVASCTSCHPQQHVLGSVDGKHARCIGCHDKHDVQRPKACSACHAQVANHPSADAKRPCDGCHPIHRPPDGGARVVACATCHQGHASHATASCTSCHAPHTAKPVLATSLCATCHGDKSRATAATGHASCLGCHTDAAHDPAKPRPTCATCHAAQAQSAPKGHQDCATCHAGADHAPKTPRPSCASCHQDRTQHGHGAALACTTCHRAHGGGDAAGAGSSPSVTRGGVAKPPACTSCHAVAKLPGLHQIAKHQACTTCHGSHEAAPKSDRATCTSCHTDRAGHQPGATSCKGCHPFSAGTGAAPTLILRP